MLTITNGVWESSKIWYAPPLKLRNCFIWCKHSVLKVVQRYVVSCGVSLSLLGNVQRIPWQIVYLKMSLQVTVQELPQPWQDIRGSCPWKLIATEILSVQRSRMKTQNIRCSLLVSCDWQDPGFGATAAGWRHCKCFRQVHTLLLIEHFWAELSLPGWHLILLPRLRFRSTTWHRFASD